MAKTRPTPLIKGKWIITFLILASPFRLPAPPPTNPAISDIPDQRIFTGTATRPINFIIGDPQTPSENLTLSASSSNTSLVPTSKIVFGGSGSNRTVTITPVTNLNGNATITIKVKNGNGKTASDSFVLSVGGFTQVPLGQIGLVYGASAWGDYNNDGLLDLLITGAGPDSNPNTKLIRNNGNGSFTEIATTMPPVSYGAVEWGDYDNDGDLDILLAGAGVNSDGIETRICRIYRNNGDETFTDINAGLQGSSKGSVAWVDFDNDGDLDAFASGSFITQLYRNDGGTFVSIPTTLPGLGEGKAIWGDYDNDGDKDLFIIGEIGGSLNIARIYRNDGSGNFAATGVNLATGYHCTGAWGDYDQDGNLDLGTTGGNRDTGFTRIYHNDGSDTFSPIATGFPAVERGSAAWADFDNDGNLDFTFTGVISNSTTVTCLFFNRGSNQFELLNTPLPGVWFGETTWADFDNDGDLDLLLSGYQGGVGYTLGLYRNDGAMPNPSPGAPTNLTIGVVGGGVLLNWAASTDLNQSGGFSYNLRMGTSPGAIDICSPMANVNTGFRRVASMGNAGQSSGWMMTNLVAGTYYWSVQAIDNSFAGSPFAAEHSFTLTAPAVTTHPQSQTVIAGANVVFTSDASGTAPLDFQWRFNGTNLAGATNSTLNLTNVQSAQQGNYSVVVSSGFGSAISSNAFLTVLVPPSFSQQPQSQTNVAGFAASISATVIGTQPLSYQWFFNGAPLANGGRISGATDATLSIAAVETNDTGAYFVIVTNTVGSATSSIANLEIVLAPAIANQPVGQVVVVGETAGFIVEANGTEPLTYQWRFNNNDIAGATNQSLTLTNLQSAQQGNYSVVVSNPFATTTSSNAFLTVLVPPSFTQQPQNQLALVGTNVVFSVSADGSKPLGYQWFFDNAPLADSGRINGANSAVLSISAAQTNDSGNYFIVITNLAGSVTSVVATLDVGQPPLIVLDPISQTNLVGSNVSFAVEANGTGPLAYQWRFNGANLSDNGRINGATNSVLTISNLVTGDAGNYEVIVTNAFGSVTSVVATLTVVQPPTFTTQPIGRSVVPTLPTTFMRLPQVRIRSVINGNWTARTFPARRTRLMKFPPWTQITLDFTDLSRATNWASLRVKPPN